MRTADQAFREIGEGWFLSTVAVDLPRAVYEQGRCDDAFALLAAIDETPRPPIASGRSRRRGRPSTTARQSRTARGSREARPRGVALAADSDFLGFRLMSFSTSQKFFCWPIDRRTQPPPPRSCQPVQPRATLPRRGKPGASSARPREWRRGGLDRTSFRLLRRLRCPEPSARPRRSAAPTPRRFEVR